VLTSTPLQTTYGQYGVVGQVGMPATMVGWDVDNRILEDPTGNGVGFGLAVCQGYKSDKGVTLGQLSGGALVGITRADPALPIYSTTPAGQTPRKVDTYYDTDNVAVMVRGDMWVLPATSVNSGDPAYFNSVTGQLGNSSVPNAVAIKNSRWEISSPNASQPLVPFAGLAVLRIGASAQ
jgi:hypothetical protein